MRVLVAVFVAVLVVGATLGVIIFLAARSGDSPPPTPGSGTPSGTADAPADVPALGKTIEITGVVIGVGTEAATALEALQGKEPANPTGALFVSWRGREARCVFSGKTAARIPSVGELVTVTGRLAHVAGTGDLVLDGCTIRP